MQLSNNFWNLWLVTTFKTKWTYFEKNTCKQTSIEDIIQYSLGNRLSQTIILSSQTFFLWLQPFLILWVKRTTENQKMRIFIHFINHLMVFKVLLRKAPLWKRANAKICFFQNFQVRQCNFFLSSNFMWKICSFELYYVGVAQSLKEWEKGQISKICLTLLQFFHF